jgi:hypothetical protein
VTDCNDLCRPCTATIERHGLLRPDRRSSSGFRNEGLQTVAIAIRQLTDFAVTIGHMNPASLFLSGSNPLHSTTPGKSVAVHCFNDPGSNVDELISLDPGDGDQDRF